MSADTTYQPKIQRRNNGDDLAVASGGSIDIESGGAFKVAGADITAALAGLPPTTNYAIGVAGGYKVARGVSAVTGTLDLDTGLTTVVAIVVSLDENPALTGHLATSTLAGGAGHALLAVWKPTGAGDCTPIAATAPKNVSWIAVGA